METIVLKVKTKSVFKVRFSFSFIRLKSAVIQASNETSQIHKIIQLHNCSIKDSSPKVTVLKSSILVLKMQRSQGKPELPHQGSNSRDTDLSVQPQAPCLHQQKEEKNTEKHIFFKECKVTRSWHRCIKLQISYILVVEEVGFTG